MDTYSAPSSGPSTGIESQPGYTPQPAPKAQPFQTFNDSGKVRVIETLGFESATIDCPKCGMKVDTEVKKQASQATNLAQLACGLVFIPFCFCTYPIPKYKKWYFDTVHTCPREGCKSQVAFVKHSQQRIDAKYVRSQSGAEV